MNEWKKTLDEGMRLLSVAQKTAESKKFSPPIRYNLASMGFEKCVMAVCAVNNYLPENHTLTDLFDAVQQFVSIDLPLKETVLKYEDLQKLCSLDDYQRQAPTGADANSYIESIAIVCNQLAAYCNKTAPSF